MAQLPSGRALICAATLLPVLLVSGCADSPAAPHVTERTATANLSRSSAGAACLANPTVTVSDEPGLDAAAAAAQPGTVIAIQGVIQLHLGVTVSSADVTVTCASAGSGLTFASQASDFALLYPMGDRDAIEGLTLDGTGASYALYTVQTDGSQVQFNHITCGDSCAFWVGTTNALITDNVIVQPHTGASGLHFQSLRDAHQHILQPIDGTRIERNSLTATTPTGLPAFGALRPRDGTNITVSDNVITGPWSNGISSVNVNGSEFARNVISGTSRFGVEINLAGSDNLAPSSNNVFTANRVVDAGIAGFSLNNACFNVFHGNPSLGTTPIAFELSTSTGGNVVDGTAGVSIDAGNRDCDGDGQADQNHVSGQVSQAAMAIGASLSADARIGTRTDAVIAGSRMIAQD